MKAHVIFDFDQTLLPGESTVEVIKLSLEGCQDAPQVIQRLAHIAPKALAGQASLAELLTLMKIIPRIRREHVQRYIREQANCLPEALRTTLRHLQEQQVGIHIISGGYMEWIVPLAASWGINPQHVIANRFFWLGSRALAIRPSPLLSSSKGKSAIVREWRAKGRLNGPVIIVGDGAADHRVLVNGLVDDFICVDYYASAPLDCATSIKRAEHPTEVLGLIRQALAKHGSKI